MIEYLQSIFPLTVYIAFLAGFYLLIKGADWMVEGAAAIARQFRISDLVIGLTIVSFGTSAPELVVNITASLQGNPDIAIGNIVGSNIANVLLILGVASIIYPLTVNKDTLWKEVPLSILAALMLANLVNDGLFDDGGVPLLSRADGLVLITFFIIFLYYTYGIARRGREAIVEHEPPPGMSTGRAILLTSLGLIALPIGGDWIVTGAVHIARQLHISESVISLTIIAIGTSLPEVAASAVAALKKKSDIAIGNAVGSNIFNVFWVLGLSSLIRPIPFKMANNRDVLVAALASFLLFSFLLVGRENGRGNVLKRAHGIIFLILYVIYLAYLVIFARSAV